MSVDRVTIEFTWDVAKQCYTLKRGVYCRNGVMNAAVRLTPAGTEFYKHPAYFSGPTTPEIVRFIADRSRDGYWSLRELRPTIRAMSGMFPDAVGNMLHDAFGERERFNVRVEIPGFSAPAELRTWITRNEQDEWVGDDGLTRCGNGLRRFASECAGIDLSRLTRCVLRIVAAKRGDEDAWTLPDLRQYVADEPPDPPYEHVLLPQGRIEERLLKMLRTSDTDRFRVYFVYDRELYDCNQARSSETARGLTTDGTFVVSSGRPRFWG